MKYAFRLTKQRECILSILNHQQNLITAEELYEQVKKYNKKINLSTIYRNLDFLTQKDLVVKHILKDGISRYEFKANNKKHAHHLVCVDCNEVTPLEKCPLSVDSLLKKQIEIEEFEVQSHQFEIYGLCKKCNKGKSYE